MAEVKLPPEAAIQDMRLGQGKMFVFRAPTDTSVQEQASKLLDEMSRAMAAMDGWLIDDKLRAAKANGFVALMTEREKGALAWEDVCRRAEEYVRQGAPRHQLALRVPYTMLSTLGYPCWALDRHTFSVDLFNPANELMLPYEDSRHRLWALYSYPPNFLMPDATFAKLLVTVANALNADYGFGGRWLPQVIFAYRFAEWSDNNYLKPLDASVRVYDLGYPYMLLRSVDIGADRVRRLQGEEFAIRRAGQQEMMSTCDVLHEGKYVFVRSGQVYPDANDDFVARVCQVVGKPYAKSLVARE